MFGVLQERCNTLIIGNCTLRQGFSTQWVTIFGTALFLTVNLEMLHALRYASVITSYLGRVVTPRILLTNNYRRYDIFGPKMALETISEYVIIKNILAYLQISLRAVCLLM